MKDVRFTKTGSPEFVVLGPSSNGGVEARGPEGLRVEGGPQIQTQRFLRADTVKQFSRGNSRWAATFGVWRTHASLNSAQDFLLNHPGELPTVANMLCTITINDGSLLYLTTPFIEIVESDNRLGLTTFHRYRLSGGNLTANLNDVT